MKTLTRSPLIMASIWALLLTSGCDKGSPQTTGGASSASLTFEVPEDVQTIFKRKCYICHGGGDEVKGGFNLKQLVYKPDQTADWQPMDLDAATRIKLAILPIDGETPKMPKRAGSILNPLTQEEMNRIAKWTDYPFKR